MRKKRYIFISILLVCVLGFLGFSDFQNCGPIDRKQMKEMLVQLGYEIKDLTTDPGKEKYSVTIVKSGLDIPVGIEISPSTTYIWMTVNLGVAKTDNSVTNLALLKQNSKAQPCQFYVSESGKLMMGLPIENRGVTNSILRERLESISTKVGDSKTIWQAN